MTYSRQIASNVRAEVARANLTQKDIAHVLQLSTAATSDRFKNKKAFKNDELLKIAQHLGIDVLTFYKIPATQQEVGI